MKVSFLYSNSIQKRLKVASTQRRAGGRAVLYPPVHFVPDPSHYPKLPAASEGVNGSLGIKWAAGTVEGCTAVRAKIIKSMTRKYKNRNYT